MNLKLRKKLIAKTGKVKSVDFHPSFSWILLGLYNGSISIYDYNTQSSVQYLEVSVKAIRAVKFMPVQNYLICGADDKRIRVYNYNTMEKVSDFEAHTDFIRSIVVHYKEPFFLSSSDDNTIHLYDASQNCLLIRTYQEHSDFVMRLAVNPKDYSMFASSSMDKKIKIWSFNASNSQMTLEGHTKGIGALAFCAFTDKPYLASGSDDMKVIVWDYTSKQIIFTFKGHENNLSALCFHPELPILISAAEDTSCKFWNINTGKLETERIFGYDVIWDINAKEDDNMIGFGCDEATLVIQIGNQEPLATFNASQAKIIYAQQNNIYSLNLKQVQNQYKDGEIISIPPKQLGSTDVYPNTISYSNNGRYFSILSDKEFVISTSGVYRSSCVGQCSDLSWNDNDSFIIKEGNYVKMYKEFKEYSKFKPGFAFEGVFGGPLYSIKTEDAIYMYDYDNSIFIRKIDVCPNKIIWNESKTKVALICADSTFILTVKYDVIEEYIENTVDGGNKNNNNESGCEEGFDVDYDINDMIMSGLFIGDVFVYQNIKKKINYAINGKTFSISTLSNNFYMLGYLPSTNKLYFLNKQFQLTSYDFPEAFAYYQMAILEKNNDKANKLFKNIPEVFLEKVIVFLEKFGYNEISYTLTKNQNQKFSLALKLKKLNDAWEIALKESNSEKMKMVADLAFELGEFSFGENAMLKANDLNGLLLYYSAIQNKSKLLSLAENAKDKGKFNIAFAAYYQLNDLNNCLQLLINTKRYPEAALFCRTYCPTKLDQVLSAWNDVLEKNDENNRMITKVVNPLKEENKDVFDKCEKYNDEFYKRVSNGKNEDIDSFSNYFGIDLFNKVSKGEDINMDSILEQ